MKVQVIVETSAGLEAQDRYSEWVNQMKELEWSACGVPEFDYYGGQLQEMAHSKVWKWS